MENPVPDNLDQVKKLNDFVRNILKDKHRQKDLDMDGTFEKIQSKNACVMGPLICQSCGCSWKRHVDPKKRRYPLIWIILEHILRKQCSYCVIPVITSHILEGITF